MMWIKHGWITWTNISVPSANMEVRGLSAILQPANRGPSDVLATFLRGLPGQECVYLVSWPKAWNKESTPFCLSMWWHGRAAGNQATVPRDRWQQKPLVGSLTPGVCSAPSESVCVWGGRRRSSHPETKWMLTSYFIYRPLGFRSTGRSDEILLRSQSAVSLVCGVYIHISLTVGCAGPPEDSWQSCIIRID